MAKKLTPAQIAEKQVRRAVNATADYKAGVQAVTESPTARAAKAVSKYQQGVTDAVSDGRYVDGLMSVSKEDWITATVTKGGDRYARGVEAARSKIEDFQTAFAPVRDRVSQAVQSMPSDTFEQRKARMNANVDGLHEFTYKRRRRG